MTQDAADCFRAGGENAGGFGSRLGEGDIEYCSVVLVEWIGDERRRGVTYGRVTNTQRSPGTSVAEEVPSWREEGRQYVREYSSKCFVSKLRNIDESLRGLMVRRWRERLMIACRVCIETAVEIERLAG